MMVSLLAQNTRYETDIGKEFTLGGAVPTGDEAPLDTFAEIVRTFEEQSEQVFGSFKTLAVTSGNSDLLDEKSVGDPSKNRLPSETQFQRLALTASDKPLTDGEPLTKSSSGVAIVSESKALGQVPKNDSQVWLAPPAAEKASRQITASVITRRGDPAPKAQPAIGEYKPALSTVAVADVTRIEKNAKITPGLARVSPPGQVVAEDPQSRSAAAASLGKAVGVDTSVQISFGEPSRQKSPTDSGSSLPLYATLESSTKAAKSTPALLLSEVGGDSRQSALKESDAVQSQNAPLGGSKLSSPKRDVPVGDKTDLSVSSHSSAGRELTKSSPQTFPSTGFLRTEIRQPPPSSIPSVEAQQNRDNLVSKVGTGQAEPLTESNAVSISAPSEMAAKPQRLVDRFDIRRTVSHRDLATVRAYDAEALPKFSALSIDKSGSIPDARVAPSLLTMGEQRLEPSLQVVSALRSESGEAQIRTITQSVDLSPTRQDFARTVLPQVSEAIRTTSSGSVEIKLNPEELGRVKLVMTLQDAGMVVAFSAERSETMELIRRHVDLLAQELRQSGHQSVDFQFEGEGRRQEGQESLPKFDDEPHAAMGIAELSKSQPSTKAELDGRLDIRI